MEFSGLVKITDLNDFLKPSENCSVHNNMIKTSAQNTAKVSLSDCLACSGCITSAETVLLEQHSTSVLLERIGNCHITVSISQQSYLAISLQFGLGLQETIRKIEILLKKLGINEVYDMCEARDSVLESAYLEFKQRFLSNNFPVLCSECPGWLCFALKKGDKNLLPLMSNIKTPMLVQKEIKNIQGYHVAIMPCFDKKLEGVMETGVDLVLTTTEFINILGTLDVEIDGISENFYSSTYTKTSSLGYAEYIFARAVKEIYAEEPVIEIKTTRRRDVLEIEFKDLKFCIATGFQNIQNLIREIKNNKCKYSYVEVMACPNGCLNGGGQPRITREGINLLENTTLQFYKPVDPLTPQIPMQRTLKLLETKSLRW